MGQDFQPEFRSLKLIDNGPSSRVGSCMANNGNIAYLFGGWKGKTKEDSVAYNDLWEIHCPYFYIIFIYL